jgi:hypothetical protein
MKKAIAMGLMVITLVPTSTHTIETAIVGRKAGGEILSAVGAITLAATYFFMGTEVGKKAQRTVLNEWGWNITKGQTPFMPEVKHFMYTVGIALVGLGIYLKQ